MSYAKLSLFISIICIVYSIIYESVLLKHEAYNDFIYALGVVSNCVALSIIASCIFYFVTDYFPKKHQQDQVRNYIVSHLELLERIGRNAFRDIVNNNNPTKQEFMDSCDLNLFSHPKTIDKENQSSQNITNWFEYFEHMYRTETFIIYHGLPPCQYLTRWPKISGISTLNQKWWLTHHWNLLNFYW